MAGGPLSLVFMGSPAFAVPALEAILDAGHRVKAVYTQPPRPRDRGHRERPGPVHALARERGLTVRTPASLKGEAEARAFAAFEADAAVVAAYGLILPPAILKAPRLGCLNIHASLLPRWRGAAPIPRAILAGDPESGVTIMQMDEGLDTGAILLQRRLPIGPEMTAGELHDRLAALGAALIVEALAKLGTPALTPVRQDHAHATYAEKIGPEHARIDWREEAGQVARRVRAMSPRPGAWFRLPHSLGGQRIKVLRVAVVENAKAPTPGTTPGTVLDNALTVACGAGAVRPLVLQREGKAALEAAEFLRGLSVPAGTVLPGAERA